MNRKEDRMGVTRAFILASLVIAIWASVASLRSEAGTDACGGSRVGLEPILPEFRGPWFEDPRMIAEVPAVKVPAILLHGDPSMPRESFLTRKFFEDSRIPVPADATPVTVRAYRYHPRGSNIRGAARGSGRDHLYSGSRSIKGSGSNGPFSTVNGEFQVDDFRRNGLMSLGDKADGENGGAVVEYVVARNFRDMGVPVVPHRGIALLDPRWVPDGLYRGNYELLPAQVERDLDVPRMSMLREVPTEEQKLELAAALEFTNSTHGALNAENLTGRAQIIDTGHSGAGYPILSGTYRCTICKVAHGGSGDLTLQGPLDFFFKGDLTDKGARYQYFRSMTASGADADLYFRNFDPERTYLGEAPGSFFENHLRSYNHVLTQAQEERLLEKMLSHVNPRSAGVLLSSEERAALEAVRKETLWIRGSVGYRRATGSVLQKMRSAQVAMWGRENVFYDASNLEVAALARHSLSMRFLMQLSALDRLLDPALAASVRAHVLSWLAPESLPQAQAALRVFDRALAAKQVTPAELRASLFRDYRPAIEIQGELRQKLAQLSATKDLKAVPDAVRAVIAKYVQPIEVDPARFAHAVLGVTIP